MSARIEKVTEWINGPVKNHVMRMQMYRQVWQAVAQIIDDHGTLPPSVYWQYHLDVYMDSQLIAIRRLADTRRDTASLARLIAEVKRGAVHLTRDRWLDLDDSQDDSFAHRDWATQFGGSVETHLDPTIPENDLDRLVSESSNLTEFVNEHIAHVRAPDLNRPPQATVAPDTVALREIHRATDVIGDLFSKYSVLLTAKSWHTEVLLPADWLAPFEEAWMPPRPRRVTG